MIISKDAIKRKYRESQIDDEIKKKRRTHQDKYSNNARKIVKLYPFQN